MKEACQEEKEAKGDRENHAPTSLGTCLTASLPPAQDFQNVCIVSTYHRLANADTRLGDGLGGFVFKAFWKRRGMPPFSCL